jgi:hypothetical protein
MGPRPRLLPRSPSAGWSNTGTRCPGSISATKLRDGI